MKKYLLIPLLLFPLIAGCSFNGVRGNGNMESEYRDVDEFSKIDVSGRFDVEVTVGKPTSVEIIAEENLLKFIRTKVRNNVLIISNKENIRPRKDLIIKVTTPNLDAVDCSGANDLFIENINTDRFSIDLSGAGSIKMNGRGEKLYIDISGAADLEASKFIVEDVTIDISGAASAEIFASNSLDAEISGASSIKLYGDAQKVKTDISGVASFSRVK